MYWNPANSTQIPENQKPPQTQKLRNSNSETPTQFLSFRGRVSESDKFGQFWRWRKKSKTLCLQWSDAFWEFSCRIFSDKIGQLRNTISEIGFPSFRVGLSEFPKFRGFLCREGPRRYQFRDAPDTFNFLRHAMRAIWSVRPKCSHRGVSLKETPLNLCKSSEAPRKTQLSKPL